MVAFQQYGAVAVAISATLSFISTLSLGTFISFLVAKHRHTEATRVPTSVRFLRSQAGYLFVNLLAADFTQALGFGLSWLWSAKRRIDGNSHACVFQGLAIEAGDVASAIFSLFIALHTATLLTVQKKPSDTVLRTASICAWLFTIIMTAIGPLAIASRDRGPFYSQAGNWCWIAVAYDELRLWLHYFFIFISAAGQLLSYLGIFLIIRFQTPTKRPVLRDLEAKQSIHSSPSSKGSPRSQSRPTTSSSVLRRKLDKTSMVMLLYPLVNLAVILPLSVYRLLGLAGKQGSPQALAACGCIFSLGGFANVLLYSFSRHIFRTGPHQATPGDPETPTTSSNGTLNMFMTPVSTPGSDVTRVNTLPNTPTRSVAASKLKELRLSPTSTLSGGHAIEKPASALLPAVVIHPAQAHWRTEMESREQHYTPPFSNLPLIRVQEETFVWATK